ncbi:Mbov_0395 family pilin-like conjugal transfer protein [Patescibacteria group bacterium]
MNKFFLRAVYLPVAMLAVFIFLGGTNFADAIVCPTGLEVDEYSGVCIPFETGLPDPGGEDPVTTIIFNFMQWILGIFGVLAVVSFALAGLQYFMAAGDDTSMEKAKKHMIWSIIGVVVGLIGFVVIQAIDNLLNASAGF